MPSIQPGPTFPLALGIGLRGGGEWLSPISGGGGVPTVSFVWAWPLPVRDSIFPGTEQTADQSPPEEQRAQLGSCGDIVGSAFIHIRACLPQDYPHMRMWLQHLAWFWPSWMDIEQRAWLEAKSVDPFLREPTSGGTNHKAWRASTVQSLYSESGTLIQMLNPGAKSLGSENLQWGSQSSRPQTRSLDP